MTAKKVAKQHRMGVVLDKESEYSPPDLAEIFIAGSERKGNNSTPLLIIMLYDIQYHPNIHPEIVGKKARMKFSDEGGEEK